ncbi:MAG: amphi-Trp domain-containing protein [Bacteroidetes bacterium]|jgi:amphi-Trp domain-containing protein|nr:amphi-Trp domain-containing protein [Bacteroidota bacterium]
MPEETLFKTEQQHTRQEIAAYLREVADKLETSGQLHLQAGAQSLDMAVPERVTFEVKAERETSADGMDREFSIEFELEWKPGEGGDRGELHIA